MCVTTTSISNTSSRLLVSDFDLIEEENSKLLNYGECAPPSLSIRPNQDLSKFWKPIALINVQRDFRTILIGLMKALGEAVMMP